MRERINRLARGILTAEVPELSVSPEEIAGEVRSGEVFRTFVKSIVELMNEGYDVVADATHLNQFSRRKLTQAIDMYTTDYKIIYVVFNVSIDTCVTHNANRTGRANVPENVIRNMCRDFRAPIKDEDERVIDIIEVGDDK